MTLRHLWTAFLASLGYVPRPDVAKAVAEQRAVTRAEARTCDTHSRKVDPRAFEWNAAAACAERGLYGAVAEWVIRASSEHGTCRVVNPQEAQ